MSPVHYNIYDFSNHSLANYYRQIETTMSNLKLRLRDPKVLQKASVCLENMLVVASEDHASLSFQDDWRLLHYDRLMLLLIFIIVRKKKVWKSMNIMPKYRRILKVTWLTPSHRSFPALFYKLGVKNGIGPANPTWHLLRTLLDTSFCIFIS